MSPSPPPVDPHPPWRQRFIDRLEASGRFRTATLITALAGMFATSFPVTILTIALGPIAEEFDAAETTIAWVISAPMLLSAVFFPLLGKLGDLRGHRQIFLIGFGFATIVAGLTALAWDEWSLIGFRTLAAILGGATQPTSMALIFSVYPPEQRVRAMGWWSMTGAAAPALGLALGGPLVEIFGWRVVFGLQATISLVALALAYAVLRETPRKKVRFDFAGSVALALGIGGCMFALGSLRMIEDSPMMPILGLGVGAIGLAAFVAIERRVEEPLLPLAFFRSRNFSATLVTNAMTSAGYMGSFVIAPFFILGLGYSESVASMLILMRTGALTVGSPMGGRLGERLGERGASLVGCGVMTLGLGLAAWGTWEQSVFLFVMGLIGQGLGHGWSQPSITAAISRSVDESDLGIAAASNRLFGQGGAAFGITILTLVYAGVNTPQAFATTFLVATGLSAISVITALWIGASKLELHADEEAPTAPATGR